MKILWKIIIVLLLVASVVAVVVLKRAENQSTQLQTIVNNPQTTVVQAPETNQSQMTANDSNNSPLVMTTEVVEPTSASSAEPKKLPRLVDLGADKCIPCKMMAPVLEELKTEYNGKLLVEFIDVWKNPQEGPKYKIRVIPTQIFFDADGKELFRHEGFFPKENILAKWKKFGFDFGK
jgi:thioredoxin 1